MRKALISLGLVLSTVPVATQAEDAIRPEPACPGAFPAPGGPVDFSRQLRRSLFDGKEIVVTRHYRLAFVPIPHGFRIDGELVDTEVEAPDRLSALVDMEKARPDTTTFPIYLDHAGLIVPVPNGPHPASAPKVQSLAEQMIAASHLKAQAQGQANQFVEQLFSRQGPVITQWPEALFRPGGGPRITRDRLKLPGGENGVVTMTLRPHSARPCALMQSMERIIETEVDGQQRRTAEVWTLTPLVQAHGEEGGR